MATADFESTPLTNSLERVTVENARVEEEIPTADVSPEIQNKEHGNEEEIQSKRKTSDIKLPQDDFSEDKYVAREVELEEKRESVGRDEECDQEKEFPDERHNYEYFWRHSFLSQQYKCEFVVDDKTYNSAEQYMMYQKAVMMGDKEKAEIIMALDEPQEIKLAGREVANFNEDVWVKFSQEVVKTGNMAKFEQNEDLKVQLFSTFPKTLVEASPNDDIWGIGLDRRDKRAWNKATWKGQNQLGEILTQIRDKLMESFLEDVKPDKTEKDS